MVRTSSSHHEKASLGEGMQASAGFPMREKEDFSRCTKEEGSPYNQAVQGSSSTYTGPLSKVETSEEQPIYLLKTKSVQGYGYESPNGFTILQGAKGRKDFVNSAPELLRRTRRELLEQGVFIETEEGIFLRQDYEFSSPTAAAMILMGGTANGPSMWKDKETGITIKKKWEAFDTVSKEESSSQETERKTVRPDQSEGQEEENREKPFDRSSSNQSDQNTYYLQFHKKWLEETPELQASGRYSAATGKQWTVLKGAKGRRKLQPSIEKDEKYKHIRNKRNELFKQGILVEKEGGFMELVQDHDEFNSPSLAASVLRGASSALTEWKDGEGRCPEIR